MAFEIITADELTIDVTNVLAGTVPVVDVTVAPTTILDVEVRPLINVLEKVEPVFVTNVGVVPFVATCKYCVPREELPTRIKSPTVSADQAAYEAKFAAEVAALITAYESLKFNVAVFELTVVTTFATPTRFEENAFAESTIEIASEDPKTPGYFATNEYVVLVENPLTANVL